MVKNLPAMQETQVQSLGWEDPLEKGMTTHSSILAWRIPRTEEPGGLWSMGSQKTSNMTPTKQQQTTNSQQDTKRPKRPTATFEKLGAKAGYCTQYHQMDEQTTWVTPSAQPLDTPLPSPLKGTISPHLSEQARESVYWSHCPLLQQEPPVEPCLNFLSGLLSSSID